MTTDTRRPTFDEFRRLLAEAGAPPPPAPPVAVDEIPTWPCFVCGGLFPIWGPGSSWPWLGPGRRICVPCLRAYDAEELER